MTSLKNATWCSWLVATWHTDKNELSHFHFTSIDNNKSIWLCLCQVYENIFWWKGNFVPSSFILGLKNIWSAGLPYMSIKPLWHLSHKFMCLRNEYTIQSPSFQLPVRHRSRVCFLIKLTGFIGPLLNFSNLQKFLKKSSHGQKLSENSHEKVNAR